MRHCSAIACTVEVPPRVLFCARHADMVDPALLRQLEITPPHHLVEWMATVSVMIRALAEQEGHDPGSSGIVRMAGRLARAADTPEEDQAHV